jgi:hypothetical protein
MNAGEGFTLGDDVLCCGEKFGSGDVGGVLVLEGSGGDGFLVAVGGVGAAGVKATTKGLLSAPVPHIRH